MNEAAAKEILMACRKWLHGIKNNPKQLQLLNLSLDTICMDSVCVDVGGGGTSVVAAWAG